jgi:hydroxyacyl-ACP dehydratase HTD2-like protein with hotdog domain
LVIISQPIFREALVMEDIEKAVQAARDRYLGMSVVARGYQIRDEDIKAYCYALGDQRWLELAQEEPESLLAPPAFVSIPFAREAPLHKHREDGTLPTFDGLPIPDLPLKRRMAGGVDAEYYLPVRAGDCLTAVARYSDIYWKAGRSGPIIFVIRHVEYFNQRGEKVAAETYTHIFR